MKEKKTNLMSGLAAEKAACKPAILPAAAGGAPVVWKKFPRALPFSSVSGGYHEMSAGLPSKKSGMKTRYLFFYF
jgi:hypothetical protein